MIANYSSVILKPMVCKLMPHKLVEVIKKVLTEEPESPEKINLTLDLGLPGPPQIAVLMSLLLVLLLRPRGLLGKEA